MIIRKFESPLDTHKITSRHGYMYAKCPRQLHYASKFGEMGYTLAEIKAMNWGTENHGVVKSWLSASFPEKEFKFEQHYERELPETIGNIDKIGATYDVTSHHMAIEIKPKYTIKAYTQIRVEAFVNPSWNFYVFEYIKLAISKGKIRLSDFLFPVQTGTEKDAVYVARIITALNHTPPRFPDAQPEHPICQTCLYKDRCYSTGDMSWNTFGLMTKPYLAKLKLS